MTSTKMMLLAIGAASSRFRLWPQLSNMSSPTMAVPMAYGQPY